MMGIQGIEQPEIIQINNKLRLTKYCGDYEFAYDWYQDEETAMLVDGKKDLYTMERIKRMYDYLDECGELYLIEFREEAGYRPIGDVTFWKEDLPIVIGERKYRGKGIGTMVVKCLIARGHSLGYSQLEVGEIYDYNVGSRKMFEKNGFVPYAKTAKGHRYRLCF